MYLRLIAPAWLEAKGARKVLEGEFSSDKIKELNTEGYNVYYLPNHPAVYEGGSVNGTHVDTWNYVFVDYDTKSNTYASKDAFVEAVGSIDIAPTKIVDSGNGIHAYWRVKDLDAKSYLRLTSRLVRLLSTDTATRNLCQLMRLPGSINTKAQDSPLPCTTIYDGDASYTCEELDLLLPALLPEDEAFCTDHYDRTFNVNQTCVNDALPSKFGKLLQSNHEAKSIWSNSSDDRSKDDYRLGHIMFANDFTKDEAASVLVNSAKAMARAPIHRTNYALNIVNKIWTYEEAPSKSTSDLSSSVADILKRSGDTLKGTPFRCHKRIDNTQYGFRLTNVIGVVGGSGIGKTAVTLNMFKWFCQENPDYHHFFVALEQPANEIADRWAVMSEGSETLNSKVHVLSNYDDSGAFRNLSLEEIKDYILQWERNTGNKAGCVVIDHIGALKKKGKDGENQGLIDICHSMKAFAVQTNTLLVMQSQTSREKAGIGDLELNKDAGYGTTTFEWYCDYLLTLWQPLKRCHNEPACPTVTAFKYCKIRFKKKNDVIKEDTCYYLYYDTETGALRDMTQDEETSFNYFLPKATNKRKSDRKTDMVQYNSVVWKETPDVKERS